MVTGVGICSDERGDYNGGLLAFWMLYPLLIQALLLLVFARFLRRSLMCGVLCGVCGVCSALRVTWAVAFFWIAVGKHCLTPMRASASPSEPLD